MSEDLQRKIQSELDSFKNTQKGMSFNFSFDITSHFVRVAESNFIATATRRSVK
jgi:hypothetical protein